MCPDAPRRLAASRLLPTNPMGNVERLLARRTDKVAVLLNANARNVSDGLKRELENFVPPEDLYYSRCFEDARTIARQVLDKGYHTILTGGGDGTFVGYVNCLFEQAQQPRGATRRRLGVVEDILRARSGEVSIARPPHLLSHEGKRAPFAGLGIDAAVLNDYVSVKDRLGPGAAGYFCSIVGKTLPACLLQRSVPTVEVVNLGGPVQQLGPDGKQVGSDVERGEILFRGPCKIAAAGTVPNYGFGFQIFPHALMAPGRFQLRLTAIGVPRILANLRTLWRGGPAPAGIYDFHCDRVLIKFDREMPLQVGGDAEGYRREVIFEMAERPLELIDFPARG